MNGQINGSIVADFASSITGIPYDKYYQECKEEDTVQTENAKKAFTSLVNKINECDKKRLQDVID